MIKKLIPVLLAISLLFAGCAPQTSVTVDGITYAIDSGDVTTDNGYAVYSLNKPQTTLLCNIDEEDVLVCHDQAVTMVMRMSGPAPAPVELPELTEEEMATAQAEAEETPREEQVMSWTSFEPCGRYHGAVSVLETLGDFNLTCTSESSFTITLPQAVDTLICYRHSVGWGCDTGDGMSFWFYLTP